MRNKPAKTKPIKAPQQIKTEWNLSLLYLSSTDPQIEKDVVKIENAYQKFAGKYGAKSGGLKNAQKNSERNYLESELGLLASLKDWEVLNKVAGSWKPVIYFSYLKDIDSANPEAEANLSKLVNRLTKSANLILFYTINLGKIPASRQKQFLASETLKQYRYFLELIFTASKYNLTEAEEKILNLKSQPSYDLWVQGQTKLLTAQMVEFRGQQLSIPEAANKIPQLKTIERRKLHDSINNKMKSIAHFAEAELNAIYTNKKIDDELRGFAQPYSSTILSYQNNEESILNLVKTVTDNKHISQRFFRLKAQLLNLKSLEYADRFAEIGATKRKVSQEEGLGIIERSFAKINPLYAEVFRQFLKDGRIDIHPKKGKRGGAYCSSGVNTPTFILTNYSENIDSVMTIGHEMGHAIHDYLSKSQPVLYQGCVVSTAEVASTLFENFVFQEIFETLSDKEKIVALHDRLTDDITTVFMQIAGFNFELELHNRVRAEGFVPATEIAAMLLRNQQVFLGNAVRSKESDGYFFVRWPHLRYFFYVYSYSFGQLISKALYSKYHTDPSFMKEIELFLKAGTSKSPEDIFRTIGIDISKPKFFTDGLITIEADIERLEKLTRNKRKL
jgi:oligoendopeptidase F